MDTQNVHILFLDGECLVCRRSAYFVHRLDHAKNMHFSALQGETANMLPPEWCQLTDADGAPTGSVVLAEHTANGEYKYWLGTNAMLRSLFLTKSIMSLFWIFYYTPAFLKDMAYRQVAKNRYRLSAANKDCPLPTQSFKDAMLP